MTSSTVPWTTAPLVALDLEGSGAQDHDNEAILEIAVVPITAGQPDTTAAYITLINPGRTIPRPPGSHPAWPAPSWPPPPPRPTSNPNWPTASTGRIVVGHNIGVDWRLLHRRYPAITPTGLIDTLRLARHLKLGTKNSLSALTTQLGLTDQIERLADGSQPHRPLWDTIAAALLLAALITRTWPDGATLTDLLDIAAIDPATPSPAKASQTALF